MNLSHIYICRWCNNLTLLGQLCIECQTDIRAQEEQMWREKEKESKRQNKLFNERI